MSGYETLESYTHIVRGRECFQTEGMEVGTDGKSRIYCLRYGRGGGLQKSLTADCKFLEDLW